MTGHINHIDWEELFKNEDKLIENSGRKHWYQFKSLDSMSEVLVYQESIVKYREHEQKMSGKADFIEAVNGEKPSATLRRLTVRANIGKAGVLLCLTFRQA